MMPRTARSSPRLRRLRTLASATACAAVWVGCAHAPDGIGDESEAGSETSTADASEASTSDAIADATDTTGRASTAGAPSGCADPERANASRPPADPEAAREAIARLSAASDAWDATCKRPGPHGLCIAVGPAEARGEPCGDRVLGRVDVRARSKAAESAREELAAAIASTEALGAPEDPALAHALADARGRAVVQHADADLEAYLALAVPKNLDFYVEEWKKDSGDAEHEKEHSAQKAKVLDSMKRFKEFYEAKNELGSDLMAAYAETKRTGSAPWTTDAALRTAWLGLHFADELRGAPTPPSLKTAEMRDAYCTSLDDQARRLEDVARDAATYCVERSADFGIDTDATAACRDLLARLPLATP